MEVKEIFLLGELFERVQLENIFADGKTFVDSIPLSELSQIKDSYEKEKIQSNFSLKDFVSKNFTEPLEIESKTNQERIPLLEHLEKLWTDLTKEPAESNDSLIKLPYKYVIPGGRFREIYYWDSYFTMLGLEVSKKGDLIQNMVDNFSYLLSEVGYIPNGNRTYYLGRSQPPFFACMIQLLAQIKGPQIMVQYLDVLLLEHNFWMNSGRTIVLEETKILNHYSDKYDSPRPESFKEDFHLASEAKDFKVRCRDLRAGAESGWDFSSRWFKVENDFKTIHTTEILPIDLNCLLYNLEMLLMGCYYMNNDGAKAASYRDDALRRAGAINKYFWNEVKGFYFDYDHVAREQKNCMTLAACYPLFFNIASEQQAKSVAKKLKENFLCAGGLVTTMIDTGQQWDAPNGWAPLQWIAIRGLLNYHEDELAKTIAERWMNINERVFENTGKMMEKYNVQDETLLAGGGEYPAQDGFGWTNGIYLKLNSMYRK